MACANVGYFQYLGTSNSSLDFLYYMKYAVQIKGFLSLPNYLIKFA